MMTAGTSAMADFEFKISGFGVGVGGIPIGQANSSFTTSVSDRTEATSSSSEVVTCEIGELDLYYSELDVDGKLSKKDVGEPTSESGISMLERRFKNSRCCLCI